MSEELEPKPEKISLGLLHRLSSRKLWLVIGLIMLISALPLAYKKLEITDTITLWVLSAVTVMGASYLGINVLQKMKLPGGNE